MKHLYLIRGLPGSGKSTFAQDLAQNIGARHYEADMYFMSGGVYVFDVNLLHKAHQWCQNVTNLSMSIGKSVVVSNTFTTEKELKPYLDMAEQYGYRVTSMVIENRHGSKSVHDVPETTMDKMRNRFSVKL